MGLMLIGIPVAFTFGILSLVMFLLADLSPLAIPMELLSTADSFALLSVPLFLLMSHILLQGGIGKDLFAAVQSWVGHWPGGLSIATIISCTIFAAISGSSVATAATIGNVAITEMTERGYNRRFVLGLLAAGGTLGILIPPSIPMIIYGVITEESIVDLFMAGFGPGLLLAGLFILYSIGYSMFGGAYQPSSKATSRMRVDASLKALPTFLLAVVIIGGIYAGVFTPTESAGIGVTLSLIIVIAMRRFDWSKFQSALQSTMKTTVTIFLIVAGAKIFGKAITLYDIPQQISETLIRTIHSPGIFILAICVILLIMGFFLESMSMLLLMVPILYPTVLAFNLDVIWFGIIFVIMIECALISPPVGLNLFVIQAVDGGELIDVIRGVWPFFLIMLGSVFLIYFIPDIALYLPFKLFQ